MLWRQMSLPATHELERAAPRSDYYHDLARISKRVARLLRAAVAAVVFRDGTGAEQGGAQAASVDASLDAGWQDGLRFCANDGVEIDARRVHSPRGIVAQLLRDAPKYKSGDIAYWPDIQAESGPMALFPSSRSVAASCFWIDGELTGFLIAESPTVDAFTPDDQALLNEFAEDAAAVLHKSRLFDLLLAREHYFRTLIESSADLIGLADQDARLLYVSPAYTTVLGYRADELVGHIVYEFIHPDDQSRVMEAAKSALENPQTPILFRYRFRHRDGSWRHLETLTYDVSRGQRVAYIVNSRDVTDQVAAEQVLEEQEGRLRAIFEGAAVGIALVDIQTGRTLTRNPALHKMLGYSAEELASKNFIELTHPDDIDKEQALYQELKRGERDQYQLEKRYIRKNGEIMWGRLTVSAVRSSSQDWMGYCVGMTEDITEQKRIEETLRRRDAILEAARFAAEQFLYAQDWETSLHAALQRLGEATGVDEIRLAENVPDEHGDLMATLRYLWRRETGPIVRPQTTRLWRESRLSRWADILAQGEAICGLVSTLPPQEQEALADSGIQSIAVEPILLGNRWWGMLRFHHIYSAHEWHAAELDALRIAAGTLGAAIQRRQVEEALRISKETAEAATQAKSAFLANMSHEIRTPLNAIVGMTSLLATTQLDAQQSDFVETIRTSSEILLTVINDILDFSKIEAHKMELEYQPYDLRSCIEHAFDLVRIQASEKHLALSYRLEAGTPTQLVGDVTRLRQILANLLSNAVKFTDHGEVSLSVSATPIPAAEQADRLPVEQDMTKEWYQFHFAVRDTGIGIPRERMNRLFGAFSQVDASTTRRFGGTGLGLVISLRLSELMGGTMWAESDGIPGKGSTFHFTLVAPASLPQEPEYDVNLQGTSISIETDEDRKGGAGYLLPNLSDLPVENPQALRLLLAEDNGVNQKVALHILRRIGYEADVVANGLEVLASLERQPYDVVLMDVQMPEMDGLEAVRAIRNRWPATDRPYVIAMTAYAMSGDRERCLEAGMNDYISKPVHMDELSSALHRAKAAILSGGSHQVSAGTSGRAEN